MVFSRRIVWCFAASIGLLALYSAVSLLSRPGSHSLAVFADLVQSLVPLFANAGLLLNAGTPHWRRNLFWMLIALSCTLWMIGQFEWTYYEVYLRKTLPSLYSGDVVFFIRATPMLAALALRPHLKRGELRLRFGYLDFVLLLTWWLFLYSFVVLPWLYASPSLDVYNFNFNLLTNIQNAMVVTGLGILWFRSTGAWRSVYAHLLGGWTLYMLASMATNVAIDSDKYYSGSLYDLPMVGSFLWLALAGVIAYEKSAALDAPTDGGFDLDTDAARGESSAASRLAMAAVISLPVFAIYTLRFGHDDSAVRDFRLMATLIAAVPLGLLVFLRTHFADVERARLLARSEQSLENLQRLQAQLVQTEKLVSLGQLAAGAAHEINNPLTAILGFSDLLADDATLPEKTRTIAAKIRDQARRTKTLVGNLLSFARQVPTERTLLDINTVVNNAVQLRALDLHGGKVRIETQFESVLPGVRGDANKLMQVFFNIVSNALDAIENVPGGGVLTIKTVRDRANVVVFFLDNGPGIKEPSRVFDPFYTTKPVGKGTGLGLSICFGIIQEHGGKILCYNRQEGGAAFRVELPAALAAPSNREVQLASVTPAAQKPN